MRLQEELDAVIHERDEVCCQLSPAYSFLTRFGCQGFAIRDAEIERLKGLLASVSVARILLHTHGSLYTLMFGMACVAYGLRNDTAVRLTTGFAGGRCWRGRGGRN